jgi:hypothetical protein
LFNKNIAYADLVVSWPSKNKGNSIVLMLVLGETTELTDDGSTEGEWSRMDNEGNSIVLMLVLDV